MTRIAVIGAGLSGLVCARMLADCAQVRVFEPVPVETDEPGVCATHEPSRADRIVVRLVGL